MSKQHRYPEELAAIRELATETHFYTDERRGVCDARTLVKECRLPEATILLESVERALIRKVHALEAVERKLQEKLAAVRGLCRKTAETITGEEAVR